MAPEKGEFFFQEIGSVCLLKEWLPPRERRGMIWEKGIYANHIQTDPYMVEVSF